MVQTCTEGSSFKHCFWADMRAWACRLRHIMEGHSMASQRRCTRLDCRDRHSGAADRKMPCQDLHVCSPWAPQGFSSALPAYRLVGPLYCICADLAMHVPVVCSIGNASAAPVVLLGCGTRLPQRSPQGHLVHLRHWTRQLV